MTQILSMRREDNVAVDTTVLMRLEVALGAARSREILGQACCEIIEKLTEFEVQLEAGQRDRASRLARGISALSAEIGLTELSRAGQAVVACLAGDDHVALAATAHRLGRLSEVSLDILLHNGAEKDV